MIKYRVQFFYIGCCLLLILTSSQLAILGSTAEVPKMSQPAFESTTTSKHLQIDSPTAYEEYVQDMLELILNKLWDAETTLFYNEVGQDGTATLQATYMTLEQATCINALAYAYPRVKNQTLSALILDRMTNTVDFFVSELWDADGAVVSGYPQEENPVRYTLYQAITASALIAAHEQVDEDNYLSKANMAIDFMLQQLWDNTNGGFYFGEFNGTTDRAKGVQSQAMAIIGLISAFEQFGNETYIDRARQTAEFVLTHLWDSHYGGFYVYSEADGTVPEEAEVRQKRTVTQALMIRALSELYPLVNDNRYLAYINETLTFSMNHLWDPESGGFYAHVSEDGLIVDDTLSKAPSKQFYMALALLEANKTYRDLSPDYANYVFSIALEILDIVLREFWDVEYGGFFIAKDMMGEVQNTNKFAIPQALGVEVLQKILEIDLPAVSRLQWDPIVPTPFDRINFSVFTIGLSSIEAIVLKYKLNNSETVYSIPMESNSQVTKTYGAQIGPFPNGTQVSVAVWANNSEGEEFSGKSNRILVTEDRIGPEVHLTGVTPSAPTGDDQITITVHTVDNRPHIAVERVTISYRVTGSEGDWETHELIPMGMDMFNVTIGPFPGDSTIEFYFTGYDAFGNPGETGVQRIEVGPEQRTIGGYEWLGTLLALVSWFSIRYYRSSRRKICE